MKKIVPKDAVLIPEEAKRMFEGVIYDVYHWQQKLFDGSETVFEMLKRVDTVKALCVVDDKILLLAEDQPNAPARGYELPGGRVERGAQSLEREIKREVQEETGFAFVNWKLIHVQQVGQHIEGFFHYYLATQPQKAHEVSPEAGEHIKMLKVTLEELKQFARDPRHGLLHIEPLIRHLNDVSELEKIPEFQGQEVDR